MAGPTQTWNAHKLSTEHETLQTPQGPTTEGISWPMTSTYKKKLECQLASMRPLSDPHHPQVAIAEPKCHQVHLNGSGLSWVTIKYFWTWRCFSAKIEDWESIRNKTSVSSLMWEKAKGPNCHPCRSSTLSSLVALTKGSICYDSHVGYLEITMLHI